jgi:pimeloyl-ACP methyl ester carboxylesterase
MSTVYTNETNLSFWLRLGRAGSFATFVVSNSLLSSVPGMAQAESKTFKIRTPDGVMISAQEWGNPDGLEILLIHGFSQSHLSWSRQFGSELAKTFRIITYDIRGHGGSEKPLDAAHYRDHKRWAEELNAVMEGAKLKRPVLVGWSYGGRILVEYLMEYGDINIAGINFVGAFTKVVPELLGPATPAVMKMVSENPVENIENTRTFLEFSTAKALPTDELELMLAYNMVAPAKVRRHLLHRPAAYEATLRKITVPVLVTHGTQDRVALVLMARYTESVVANAQVSLYEGVGHMPFWEDAPRFNRELGEFVTKCNGR